MDNEKKVIDELKEYREKLSKLTEEEQKQRDLYLKQLADGTLQGPPVGMPSIDKVWLKYYPDDKIIADVPKYTIYKYRYEKNKDYNNDVALNYFGVKITNKQYEQKIEQTAKALKNMGIKKGDVISVCSVNTPETGYLLYAANKIGAIVDFFDPRTNANGIRDILNKTESKTLFILDKFVGATKSWTENTKVENVICISPYDSLSPVAKKLVMFKRENKVEAKKVNEKIKNLKEKYRIDKWNQFIDNGKYEKKIVPVEYEENAVAAIVHTGGTTGSPKGVNLTNENFIALCLNYQAIDFDIQRQDKFLNILVPWVAYGLVFTFFVTSCLNLEHILIPSFSPEMLPKLILKHKPNHILGIPAYFEKLLSDKTLVGKDLSFLKLVASGGDHISPDLENKLNEFLKEHNSASKFVKGYGMTEVSSSAATNLKQFNEVSSVGAPLAKNIISIFDPETQKEKGYGEKGEICIQTPTMMKGYDDPSKDESVIKIHEDGSKWVHSGDIGYMTKDGGIYVIDRMKRMIIRKGFKVYPFEIENVITSHPGVDFCTVVGIPNDEDVHTPKAFMVLNEKYIGQEEIVLDEVKKLLKENLPEYEIPYTDDYEIRESIPHTNLGKVDFNALLKEETSKKKRK